MAELKKGGASCSGGNLATPAEGCCAFGFDFEEDFSGGIVDDIDGLEGAVVAVYCYICGFIAGEARQKNQRFWRGSL